MNKFKKITAIVLCFVLAVANISMAFGQEVKANDYDGHWAHATIEKWLEKGMISGYTDGSFKPDANITRAEFVKLVNSIIDYDTKGKISYSDVTSTAWYYDYVSVAKNIGYIQGYPNGNFGPNDYITREQAAAIISRIQFLDENTDGISDFTDKSKVSQWAEGSIGAATSNGFISGYSDNSFKPLKNLTRAEALTMLDNVLENSKNVIVYNAGAKIKDVTVGGDLVIAETVGDGDVYLDNVEVKGAVKVYGGGENSVHFNKVKAAKILVNKNKVRIVLGDGTEIKELSIDSQTVIENASGQVGKITITSDGQVTLSGKFDEVTVSGKADIVLKNAKIKTLIANETIEILGKGTVEKLQANADGIKYESKISVKNTVVGKDVTEKPTVKDNDSTTNDNDKDNDHHHSDHDKTYHISITASVGEDFERTFTTDAYTTQSAISDFMVTQISDIAGKTSEGGTLDTYLTKVSERLDNITIGQTQVFSNDGLNKLLGYLDNTSYKNNISDIKSKLSDGEISLEDLKDILDLYNSADLLSDLTEIKNNLAGYDFTSQEVKYNTKDVNYTVKYGSETLDNNKDIADFILNNIAFSTKTVDEFFNEFGNTITINAECGDKISTITIMRKAY